MPIHSMHEYVSFNELIAFYSVSDVCLVSSTRCEMNLVSYEYDERLRARHEIDVGAGNDRFTPDGAQILSMMSSSRKIGQQFEFNANCRLRESLSTSSLDTTRSSPSSSIIEKPVLSRSRTTLLQTRLRSALAVLLSLLAALSTIKLASSLTRDSKASFGAAGHHTVKLYHLSINLRRRLSPTRSLTVSRATSRTTTRCE
jgi:hypothetical protein